MGIGEERLTNLDPLARHIVGNVGSRVRVLGSEAAERGVDELLHLLVDDGDADSLQADAEREGRNDVDIDGLEPSITTTCNRVGSRCIVAAATLQLEDAVLLVVVGEGDRLGRSLGSNVDGHDASSVARREADLGRENVRVRRRGRREPLTRNLRSNLEHVDETLLTPNDDLQLLVTVGRKIPGVGEFAVSVDLVLLATLPGLGGRSLGQLQPTTSAASVERGDFGWSLTA